MKPVAKTSLECQKKKACTVTNGIFSYVSISLCEVLANYIQIGLHLNVLWDVNN